MHDSPEPTEREQEQAVERVPEEQAKSGQGHDDPESKADPQDEQEVHDA